MKKLTDRELQELFDQSFDTNPGMLHELVQEDEEAMLYRMVYEGLSKKDPSLQSNPDFDTKIIQKIMLQKKKQEKIEWLLLYLIGFTLFIGTVATLLFIPLPQMSIDIFQNTQYLYLTCFIILMIVLIQWADKVLVWAKMDHKV